MMVRLSAGITFLFLLFSSSALATGVGMTLSSDDLSKLKAESKADFANALLEDVSKEALDKLPVDRVLQELEKRARIAADQAKEENAEIDGKIKLVNGWMEVKKVKQKNENNEEVEVEIKVYLTPKDVYPDKGGRDANELMAEGESRPEPIRFLIRNASLDELKNGPLKEIMDAIKTKTSSKTVNFNDERIIAYLRELEMRQAGDKEIDVNPFRKDHERMLKLAERAAEIRTELGACEKAIAGANSTGENPTISADVLATCKTEKTKLDSSVTSLNLAFTKQKYGNGISNRGNIWNTNYLDANEKVLENLTYSELTDRLNGKASETSDETEPATAEEEAAAETTATSAQ